jgi:hypothetical protein
MQQVVLLAKSFDEAYRFFLHLYNQVFLQSVGNGECEKFVFILRNLIGIIFRLLSRIYLVPVREIYCNLDICTTIIFVF